MIDDNMLMNRSAQPNKPSSTTCLWIGITICFLDSRNIISYLACLECNVHIKLKIIFHYKGVILKAKFQMELHSPNNSELLNINKGPLSK